MNDLIKLVLTLCGLLSLLAVNNIIFDTVFRLDTAHAKNIGLSVLFSLSATAVELGLIRTAMGKMRVKLIWE